MSKSLTRWGLVALGALLLIGGMVIGTGLKAEGLAKFWHAVAFQQPAPSDDGHGGHDDHAHDGDIVEVSETVSKNLDIRVGLVSRQNYQKFVEIPAQVIERLPAGRRMVTAPIAGTISKVFIAPSQAIKAGDALYELNVTDDEIAEAQVRLLNLIANIEGTNKKLNRLRPLANDGSIPQSRLIDMELEMSGQKASYDAACQELILRGMSQEQLADLIQDQKLLQTLTIYAPELPDGETMDETSSWFIVESIKALNGTNLARGEALCTLTFHGRLFLEAYAFESDVEKITSQDPANLSFSAEFGEGGTMYTRESLSLHSISNHVDDESQTYPIYIALFNEIQREQTDDQDRTFVTWRFKPGQRAHLRFPIETWQDQYVVPRQAVAIEGPQVFMFIKVPHTHEVNGETIHEYSRVSVELTHQDKKFAVIKKDSISRHATYALSDADYLNLAMKQAASGGGGHSHAHAP